MSQQAKHTPGPWEPEITGQSPVKVTAGNSIVGYACFGPRSDVDEEYAGGVPVAEANARLYAAAPDYDTSAKRASKAITRWLLTMHEGNRWTKDGAFVHDPDAMQELELALVDLDTAISKADPQTEVQP